MGGREIGGGGADLGGPAVGPELGPEGLRRGAPVAAQAEFGETWRAGYQTDRFDPGSDSLYKRLDVGVPEPAHIDAAYMGVTDGNRTETERRAYLDQVRGWEPLEADQFEDADHVADLQRWAAPTGRAALFDEHPMTPDAAIRDGFQRNGVHFEGGAEGIGFHVDEAGLFSSDPATQLAALTKLNNTLSLVSDVTRQGFMKKLGEMAGTHDLAEFSRDLLARSGQAKTDFEEQLHRFNDLMGTSGSLSDTLEAAKKAHEDTQAGGEASWPGGAVDGKFQAAAGKPGTAEGEAEGLAAASRLANRDGRDQPVAAGLAHIDKIQDPERRHAALSSAMSDLAFAQDFLNRNPEQAERMGLTADYLKSYGQAIKNAIKEGADRNKQENGGLRYKIGLFTANASDAEVAKFIQGEHPEAHDLGVPGLVGLTGASGEHTAENQALLTAIENARVMGQLPGGYMDTAIDASATKQSLIPPDVQEAAVAKARANLDLADQQLKKTEEALERVTGKGSAHEASLKQDMKDLSDRVLLHKTQLEFLQAHNGQPEQQMLDRQNMTLISRRIELRSQLARMDDSNPEKEGLQEELNGIQGQLDNNEELMKGLEANTGAGFSAFAAHMAASDSPDFNIDHIINQYTEGLNNLIVQRRKLQAGEPENEKGIADLQRQIDVQHTKIELLTEHRFMHELGDANSPYQALNELHATVASREKALNDEEASANRPSVVEDLKARLAEARAAVKDFQQPEQNYIDRLAELYDAQNSGDTGAIARAEIGVNRAHLALDAHLSRHSEGAPAERLAEHREDQVEIANARAQEAAGTMAEGTADAMQAFYDADNAMQHLTEAEQNTDTPLGKARREQLQALDRVARAYERLNSAPASERPKIQGELTEAQGVAGDAIVAYRHALIDHGSDANVARAQAAAQVAATETKTKADADEQAASQARDQAALLDATRQANAAEERRARLAAQIGGSVAAPASGGAGGAEAAAPRRALEAPVEITSVPALEGYSAIATRPDGNCWVQAAAGAAVMEAAEGRERGIEDLRGNILGMGRALQGGFAAYRDALTDVPPGRGRQSNLDRERENALKANGATSIANLAEIMNAKVTDHLEGASPTRITELLSDPAVQAGMNFLMRHATVIARGADMDDEARAAYHDDMASESAFGDQDDIRHIMTGLGVAGPVALLRGAPGEGTRVETYDRDGRAGEMGLAEAVAARLPVFGHTGEGGGAHYDLFRPSSDADAAPARV